MSKTVSTSNCCGTEDLKRIYENLQDLESKNIFKQIVNFVNGEHDYIIDSTVLNTRKKTRPLQELITNKDAHRKIIIFGAGTCGRWTHHLLKSYELPVEGFCDNSPSVYGDNHCGLPVVAPNELYALHKNSAIAISVLAYQPFVEIYNDLISMGFLHDQIYDASTPQTCAIENEPGGGYFEQPFITPEQEEVFVDAGSFDGADIQSFYNFCHGKHKMIYALEPDITNYEKTLNNIENNKLERVLLINKGAWSCDTTRKFNIMSGVSSKLTEHGKHEVHLTSIDSMLNGEKVSFIKMNIEGAETEALKGAAIAIKTHKPRLMIALHHKPADIYEIPMFIESLSNEYKFYIRSFSKCFAGLFLYAV
ncbi:MAG: FkbM family methyltransferase [Defluviitaleaceae bacterium]|nr:FkbM family methyltransferase [Defluviitaleaceae bacterium]